MGRVLDLVDEMGVTGDTVTILTGDHGWQLGEHAEWGKHTNWELAVQVPLLIRAPWTSSAGMHTESFIELLDLYRTVSALAGVAVPDAGVGGQDLSAVLDDPSVLAKNLTYSQYSRCPGDRYWPQRAQGHPAWFMNNCEGVPAANISYMGYSVRSREYRYTEWVKWSPSCKAQWPDQAGPWVELYSHRGQTGHPLDFDAWENENLATDPTNRPVLAAHRDLVLARFKTSQVQSLGCPPPLPSGHGGEVSWEEPSM